MLKGPELRMPMLSKSIMHHMTVHLPIEEVFCGAVFEYIPYHQGISSGHSDMMRERAISLSQRYRFFYIFFFGFDGYSRPSPLLPDNLVRVPGPTHSQTISVIRSPALSVIVMYLLWDV